MRPAADHQTVTITFFGEVLVSGSVLGLHRGPTTARNVVDYRRGSISHRKLRFGQETDHSCCAEEATMTPHNGNFFF